VRTVPDARKHGTAIGWTHWPDTTGETLVTVTGCTPVSPGCDNCFSAVGSSGPRLMRLEKYRGVAVDGQFTGLIKLHPDVLLQARRWRNRRTIFYNSMGDTFHDQVPKRFIARGFAMAAGTPWHNWLKLTKRHGRLRALLRSPAFRDLVLAEYRALFGPTAALFDWPLPNVAVGVSVENQDLADRRMPYLMDLADDAACLFVSCEPLLDAVDLAAWLALQRFAGQLWVIAGGESGTRHRPVDLGHVRDIRDDCLAADVAFYFKQVGGRTPNAGGRLLDGWEHNGLPAMAYRTVAATR
jgi:protein gp37